jgi:hypothetical protein
VVPYSVAPNPAPAPRSGSVSVGPETVSLSQAAAPCVFNLSSARGTIGASGGRLSVGVSTLAGCAWTASSASAWITITSGQSGNASGTVTLQVASNIGDARTGSASIAGQTYSVAQDSAQSTPAPPSPSPSPSPPPSPPPTPSLQVQVSGDVLALSGQCPRITFVVNGMTITTDSSTSFKHGKCGAIDIGTSVTVTGTRTPSNTIAADVVNIQD